MLEEKDVLIPSREITRGEFIDWIVRSMELKSAAGEVAFWQIKGNAFEKSIQIAAENIVEKADTFKPNDSLIRQMPLFG